MFTLLLLGCTPQPPGPPAGPTLRERFGEHAFLTPRDAPATVALVSGGTIDTRASTCGACHVDHQHEWAQTTHAAAMRDLQFFAELAKPDQPVWLCLNCHAPTAPQRAEIITLDTRLATPGSITALVTTPTPGFDPVRVAEGVTCATCHVQRDADGEGVVIGPRGSGRAPHRVRADKAALDGICVSCHSPGEIILTETFPCWFKTADELAAGPSRDQTCVGCHMPTTTRPAATGGGELDLLRHTWTGGGVPKTVTDYTTLTERGWRAGVDVVVTTDPLTVTLTNARAGHSLPTGDPERFLRVEARLESAGATVGRDVLRLGQTWDWGDAAAHRPAHRLADERLAPGGTRTWAPKLPEAPAERLVVEVMNVRLTVENARALARTSLGPQLLTLWPEAGGLLPRLDQLYPLATFVWRGSRTLPDGVLEVADPSALLVESAAFNTLPLDERAGRLDVPLE